MRERSRGSTITAASVKAVSEGVVAACRNTPTSASARWRAARPFYCYNETDEENPNAELHPYDEMGRPRRSRRSAASRPSATTARSSVRWTRFGANANAGMT